MGTGDQSGTWGAELNNAVFTILDNALGGFLSLPLTNVNVTLTTAQSQNNFISLSGTLTGNVNIIFPNIGRSYFIVNSTSGAHTVTLKTPTGANTVVIPQGFRLSIGTVGGSGGGVYTSSPLYTPVHQGGGTSQLTNQVFIGWLGSSTLGLQIDASNFGNSWPINVTGSAGSVGGVSNPTAKNTLIAYQSGISEFGSVITDGTNTTVDLPSPYVMTGLRTSPSYAGGIATITLRGRALMTQ